MMGERQGVQDHLFYEFDLEDVVPDDHLLRRIDGVLDLSWLRCELAPFYSHTGSPSVDPELMIRMLLIGYCCSIRSERRLCQEVKLNLAYRWFCRLDIEDRVPNHSTFSVNRHGRFRDSDVLRRVFEKVVWPVHGGRPGQGRGLCGGRQRDRGGCQPFRAGRGQQSGLDGGSNGQPSCAGLPGGSSMNPNQDLSCTREIFGPERMGSILSAACCSPTIRRSRIHPEPTAETPAVEADYWLNTTPVGISPVSRYRHKAIASFRASPIMAILRMRPVNDPTRRCRA